MVHPYWEYPNQNFDSHIYPRGAAVLHMLRKITGGDKFKEFQEVFLKKYAYGNPNTNDLIDNIRNEFPYLDNTKRNLIYFDTAASSQKPRVVIESIKNTYHNSYANVHRGIYKLSHNDNVFCEKRFEILHY